MERVATFRMTRGKLVPGYRGETSNLPYDNLSQETTFYRVLRQEWWRPHCVCVRVSVCIGVYMYLCVCIRV